MTRLECLHREIAETERLIEAARQRNTLALIVDLRRSGVAPRAIATALRKRRPPVLISTARVREVLFEHGVAANDWPAQAVEQAKAALGDQVARAVAEAPRTRPYKRGALEW